MCSLLQKTENGTAAATTGGRAAAANCASTTASRATAEPNFRAAAAAGKYDVQCRDRKFFILS